MSSTHELTNYIHIKPNFPIFLWRKGILFIDKIDGINSESLFCRYGARVKYRQSWFHPDYPDFAVFVIYYAKDQEEKVIRAVEDLDITLTVMERINYLEMKEFIYDTLF